MVSFAAWRSSIMNDRPKHRNEKTPSALSREVGAKVARKLKARCNSTPGVWYGLGMMGLIGWSVAIPTLLGAAIGLWLDKQQLGQRSWTLALLVAGLYDRLLECLAMGRQRGQGDARRIG